MNVNTFELMSARRLPDGHDVVVPAEDCKSFEVKRMNLRGRSRDDAPLDDGCGTDLLPVSGADASDVLSTPNQNEIKGARSATVGSQGASSGVLGKFDLVFNYIQAEITVRNTPAIQHPTYQPLRQVVVPVQKWAVDAEGVLTVQAAFVPRFVTRTRARVVGSRAGTKPAAKVGGYCPIDTGPDFSGGFKWGDGAPCIVSRKGSGRGCFGGRGGGRRTVGDDEGALGGGGRSHWVKRKDVRAALPESSGDGGLM